MEHFALVVDVENMIHGGRRRTASTSLSAAT
jgi:hypothetical protein